MRERGREDSRRWGWVDKPTKEQTGRTGMDEEDGGSIEVGAPVVHPGGMTKGHLGPEVQGVKGKTASVLSSIL